jgi:hypothetical protein
MFQMGNVPQSRRSSLPALKSILKPIEFSEGSKAGNGIAIKAPRLDPISYANSQSVSTPQNISSSGDNPSPTSLPTSSQNLRRPAWELAPLTKTAQTAFGESNQRGRHHAPADWRSLAALPRPATSITPFSNRNANTATRRPTPNGSDHIEAVQWAPSARATPRPASPFRPASPPHLSIHTSSEERRQPSIELSPAIVTTATGCGAGPAAATATAAAAAAEAPPWGPRPLPSRSPSFSRPPPGAAAAGADDDCRRAAWARPAPPPSPPDGSGAGGQHVRRFLAAAASARREAVAPPSFRTLCGPALRPPTALAPVRM